MDIAHARTGTVDERYSTDPMRPARHLGIVAAFFGIALAAAWIAAPDGPTASLDPAERAERCRTLDAAALAAMEHRANGPEVGKQIYMQSAMMWLAEARRSCDFGSDARAERFYGRIVARAGTTAAPTSAVAGR